MTLGGWENDGCVGQCYVMLFLNRATNAVGEEARPREDVVSLERICRVVRVFHARGYFALHARDQCCFASCTAEPVLAVDKI